MLNVNHFNATFFTELIKKMIHMESVKKLKYITIK